MAKKNLIPKSKAKNAYELLAEVKALILDEPKRYNQALWRVFSGDVTGNCIYRFPACGTICCVAGWVGTLAGAARNVEDDALEDFATEVLALDFGQRNELFAPGALSRVAKHKSFPNPGTQAYARLGAEHITAFMQKYETQLKAKAV